MPRSEKWERVQAAIDGSPVDRVPFALWMHFPQLDRHPEQLARATIDLHRRYDMDYVKVMFRSSFGLEDWGCEFDRYDPRSGAWQCSKYAVRSPEDWGTLPRLAPDRGALGEQLRLLELIRDALGEEAPILATLFAPSMLAQRLAGLETFLQQLRREADAVHAGLRLVSQTVRTFGHACLQSGAHGIFYAVDLASRQVLTDGEYRVLGESHDRPVLQALHDRSHLTVLHLHGEDVMFDELASYPAHVLNWYDRQSGPSLKEARARTNRCLAGGLDHEGTLLLGTPEQAAAEVHDAVAQVNGRGLLLAPGCGVPITVPEQNLQSASVARLQDSGPARRV